MAERLKWGAAGKERASYNELHGFGAANSHEAADALITPDGKCTHGVPGLAEHWLLPCQLLQHLPSTIAASDAGSRSRIA